VAKRKADRLPVFGTDFDLGWVGFVHSSGQLLSGSIAYLTRRDKKGGVTVTHTFLVTGPNECVEANLPVGVTTSDLAKEYLGRENRRVVFRKPRELTPAVARRLVARARAEVGAKFDYGGFAALGMTDTFLGHLVDSLLGGKPKELLAGLLHQHGHYVCSELVAYCLRKEPRYREKGVLARPQGILTPQELFEDGELFEPLSLPAPRKPSSGSARVRPRQKTMGQTRGTKAARAAADKGKR
jgi:hypothetical protein